MDIVKAVAALDAAPGLHLARILLLLNAFSKEDDEGSIEGLTKLAKLDFLLRYPVMLDRALQAKGKSTREVQLEDHERQSVESEMVRYRFGPWDHRYREILNILVAKGLLKISIEGNTVVVTETELGREQAQKIAENEFFMPYVKRARVIKRNFDIT